MRLGIEESVGLYRGGLSIPSFIRGKPQLSVFEVESTIKIAIIRIHVERVIGLVHHKYKILQGPLSIKFVKSNGCN